MCLSCVTSICGESTPDPGTRFHRTLRSRSNYAHEKTDARTLTEEAAKSSPKPAKRRIGSANPQQTTASQTRPAPDFFMPAGALLAGVVEQPLRNVLPDRVAAIQSDCIGGLDFHGPLAATAGDAQHVALNLGSVSHSELEYKENKCRVRFDWRLRKRRSRIWAPVASARGSLRTESQYSAGRGVSGAAAEGLGLRAASAASFPSALGSACASSRHNVNDGGTRIGSAPDLT
jgi:hypothetical protein